MMFSGRVKLNMDTKLSKSAILTKGKMGCTRKYLRHLRGSQLSRYNNFLCDPWHRLFEFWQLRCRLFWRNMEGWCCLYIALHHHTSHEQS